MPASTSGTLSHRGPRGAKGRQAIGTGYKHLYPALRHHPRWSREMPVPRYRSKAKGLNRQRGRYRSETRLPYRHGEREGER